MSINGIADLVGNIALGAFLNFSFASNLTIYTHIVAMLGLVKNKDRGGP